MFYVAECFACMQKKASDATKEQPQHGEGFLRKDVWEQQRKPRKSNRGSTLAAYALLETAFLPAFSLEISRQLCSLRST